jgi:hypothetical protein
MHLGLLCAPYPVLGYRSPVPLAKFQMAPIPSTLMSWVQKRKNPDMYTRVRPRPHTHTKCELRFPPQCRTSYRWENCLAQLYRVSQEECAKLREIVPCVKVYRYNPKHLYPNLNGYGDNGQRSLKFDRMWKCTYSQCSSILGKDLLCLKFPRLRSPVILIRAVL